MDMTNNKEMMLAAVMTAPGQMELREFPRPEVKPEYILVRILACAICTWEQRVFAGVQKATFPLVGGHEIVGEIEAVGEGVPSFFKVGDQVSMLETYCGKCEWCRRGLPNLCSERPGSNVYMDISGSWGFGQYINLHASAVHSFLRRVANTAAVFFEPLSCAVHAARLAEISLAEDVVIIGGGTMGLLNLLVARQCGGRVMLSEFLEQRLETGRLLGANELVDASRDDPIARVLELTNGKGADVVIVAAGLEKANEQAIKMVAKCGRIVLFSSAHPAKPVLVDPNDIHRREYRLIGAVSKDQEDAQISSRMLAYGLVDPSPLVDAVKPMTDIVAAMKRAVRPDSYRVIVEPFA
jgi:threonine dehydrogenase-like Zn-dependent dehydrogenase